MSKYIKLRLFLFTKANTWGWWPPPYPKQLKHSNKTKLRLNESKNSSFDIFPYH